MPVNKKARSRSQDPAQERLRERKQVWNKACSEFIARLNAFKPHLISFKRGLNGRGDQKAGLPISNIKDPLPNEIGSFLGGTSSEFGELASTFATLVSEANSIIQEQAEYAAHRRKSQPKAQMRPGGQMPLTADLSEADDTLTVEGSNALTRFWANLSTMFSKDTLKQHRLSTLSMAHELFQILVDFEDIILTKGISNVPQVLNYYLKVSNQITALSLALQKFAELQPTPAPVPKQENVKEAPKPQTESAPEQAETPAPITEEKESEFQQVEPSTSPAVVEENASLEDLKRNIVLMINLGVGFGVEDVRPFLSMFHKRNSEKNEIKRELMEDRLREIYVEIFNNFKKIIEKNLKVHLPPNATLGYILDLQKKASVHELEIIKNSGNYFSRLLKEYSHYFGRKDSSSASRMQVFVAVREAKKHVDEIMDLLENKNVNLEILNQKMSKVEELIIEMSNPIKLLNVLYKDKYYNDVRKQKDPILDPAGRYFTKQIRRDVDKPGW